jgi:hypothetical protein
VSGTEDLCRQRGDGEAATSEEVEACFALPLREAAAHLACRNARSAEAEMGGSNDGNARASIVTRPRTWERGSFGFFA